MNERIKQLLHESIDNCDGTMTDRTHSLKSSELQKFAELIVLECEKVSKNPKWYSESPSDGWRNPIKHVCRTFKEHFGVE